MIALYQCQFGVGGFDSAATRLDPSADRRENRIKDIILHGAETIDFDTGPETNLTGGGYGRASTTCPPLDNSLKAP